MYNYYTTASGTYYIDSLISDAKWQTPLGQGATLTYSFPSDTAYWVNNYQETRNWWSFNENERSMTRLALNTWEQYANIKLTEVADEASYGDIRFAHSSSVDNSNSAGWAYTPDTGSYYYGDPYLTPSAEAGDIWIGSSYEVEPGNFNFHTLLHEIGHALGLEHPFEGPNPLPALEDSYQYSLMSYTDHPESVYYQFENSFEMLSPVTPMLYDIAAIQYLYGANTDFNSDDTVYQFDNTPQYMTLWDGGGFDTLDFSKLQTGIEIQLTAGQFSSFGYGDDGWGTPAALRDNFAIAFGADIEAVVDTPFDDLITGNELDNHFRYSGGNDHIDGTAGADIIELPFNFSDTQIHSSKDNLALLQSPQGMLSFSSIEAIQFNDGYLDPRSTIPLRLTDTSEVLAISRLYQAALDRQPDMPGLNYWVDEYGMGQSLQNISQSFVDSTEFRTRFDITSDSGFITAVYQNVLLRQPDEDGLNYWLNDIANGRSYSDILVSFSDSLENHTNTCDFESALHYDIDSGNWLL